LAERRTVDPNVAGSSPAGGILIVDGCSWLNGHQFMISLGVDHKVYISNPEIGKVFMYT
jgi:hypothetical protein